MIRQYTQIEKNYKLICENLDKIMPRQENGYNDGLIFIIKDCLDKIMEEIHFVQDKK